MYCSSPRVSQFSRERQRQKTAEHAVPLISPCRNTLAAARRDKPPLPRNLSRVCLFDGPRKRSVKQRRQESAERARITLPRPDKKDRDHRGEQTSGADMPSITDILRSAQGGRYFNDGPPTWSQRGGGSKTKEAAEREGD